MFYTNYVKILHDLTEHTNIILGGVSERLQIDLMVDERISPYGFPEQGHELPQIAPLPGDH